MTNAGESDKRLYSQVDLPENLDKDFVRKLARMAGRYGEAGGSVGRQGYRLKMPVGDKTIDVISLLGAGSLILSLCVEGDIPPEDQIARFDSDAGDGRKISVRWDRRISLAEVEAAMEAFVDPNEKPN